MAVENVFDETNTTQYPVFADAGGKAAMMQYINDELSHFNPDAVRNVLFRISNSDISGFDDATAVWDQ